MTSSDRTSRGRQRRSSEARGRRWPRSLAVALSLVMLRNSGLAPALASGRSRRTAPPAVRARKIPFLSPQTPRARNRLPAITSKTQRSSRHFRGAGLGIAGPQDNHMTRPPTVTRHGSLQAKFEANRVKASTGRCIVFSCRMKQLPKKGKPRMKQLLTRRRAAVLAAATALLISGGATASAQAATASPAEADFTCPSSTVCLFPNDNYTGNYVTWGSPAELATDGWNGAWWPFSDDYASNPDPGSLNDNSNSIIWVYAKDTNTSRCLTSGRSVLDNLYGYFYIEYGVTSCGAEPGGRP